MGPSVCVMRTNDLSCDCANRHGTNVTEHTQHSSAGQDITSRIPNGCRLVHQLSHACSSHTSAGALVAVRKDQIGPRGLRVPSEDQQRCPHATLGEPFGKCRRKTHAAPTNAWPTLTHGFRHVFPRPKLAWRSIPCLAHHRFAGGVANADTASMGTPLN